MFAPAVWLPFALVRETRLCAYPTIGSAAGSLVERCFFADATALQTSIAVASFSPMVRNRISCLPWSESKRQTPFVETNGIGKGQFSAPIYRIVLQIGRAHV